MFNLQYVKMYALETNQLSYGNCSGVPKEVAAIIFLKDFIFVFIFSSKHVWNRIYEPVVNYNGVTFDTFVFFLLNQIAGCE